MNFDKLGQKNIIIAYEVFAWLGTYHKTETKQDILFSKKSSVLSIQEFGY